MPTYSGGVHERRLHAVLRAGHRWDDDQRWFVMTFVFGDISGAAKDSVLAAACYLGREEHWQAAVAAWVALLKETGVQYFRASEFYACRGQFKDWTQNDDRHIEFAKRFTAVATDAGLIGFAWAMDQQAHNSILAPVFAKERRRYKSSSPRVQVVMNALSAVGTFLENANHPELFSVQVGFEDEQGAGAFVDFFNESQRRRESWCRWFHSFTTIPKEFEPAQIADLLAHEAWRRGKEVLSENPREIRKSFARMLADQHVELRWRGREHCTELARQTEDMLTRYPNGLVPPDGQ